MVLARTLLGRYIVVVATVALIVSTVGISASATSLYLSWKRDHAARVRACEAANRSRYGGADYLRPVIRALVAQNQEFVLRALEIEGLSTALVHINDIPALDCDTGKPQPLPKGAIR